jgi:autotransporter-associated beta strand protein
VCTRQHKNCAEAEARTFIMLYATRFRRAVALSIAVAAGLSSVGSAPGQVTLDWDSAAGDNVITSGTGTWDLSATRWTGDAGATNVAWSNTNFDTARFVGTGSTVTVGAAVSAGAMIFDSTGYTLSGTSVLTLGGTTPTVTVTSPGHVATISAILGGTTLRVDGQGTLNLTNTGNTFTGNIVVDGATLRVEGNNGAAGDPIRLGPGSKSITLQNGGTYVSHTTTTNPTGTNTKSFIIGTGGGTLQADSQITFDDAGQFSGTGDLTKTGAGVLRMTQGNTFSGAAINVNGGTLQVTNAGSLGAGNSAISIASGAAFDLQAALSGTKPITVSGTGLANAGALTNSSTTAATANGPVTLNSATVGIGGAGNITLSGVVSDGVNSHNLTKVGAGLVVLSNNANAWDGGTTVSGGVLRANNGTQLPTAGNLVLNGGAIEGSVGFTRSLGTGAGQVSIPGGASGFSATGSAVTVNLGGAGDELVWGTGDFAPSTFILNATTAGQALTLTNGIDLSGTGRTISVGANTATVSGLIRTATGTAGLTKTGAGTLVLANAGNSYNGNTTLNGGILAVGALADGTTSPIGGGNVTWSGTATLRYTGSAAVTSTRTFTPGNNAATIEVTNANTSNGLEITTTVAGNTANTLTKAGAGILTLSGTTDNNSLILNAAAGTTQLNKSGSDTVRAVAGISNIASGATVRLTGSGVDQIFGGSATGAAGLVNMSVGGTLDLNGRNEGISRLSGGGIVTNNAGVGTSSVLTLGETNGTGTIFTGAINNGAGGGTVAITKTGTGRQSLAGTSNYSGGTTINQGTVAAIGSAALGTGTVTLNGGTLAIERPVTSISGFGGNGTGFTLNNGPTVTADVLTLTTAVNNQNRSIYFNERVDTRNFTASFRYDNGSNGAGADGFTFVLQNQGLNALGTTGGARGYTGGTNIAPSIAIGFNIYQDDATSVGSNGGSLTNLLASAVTTPTVTMLDLADITVNYDGTNLSFTVTNPSNTSQTFTRSVAVNIPGIIGSAAYIGFTGATGGQNAVQTISDFTYNASVPATVVYGNDLAVQAGSSSAVQINNLNAVTVGGLSIGAGSTLNVSGTSTGANVAYSLTTGAVALTGAATVNVDNNGTGVGTVRFGDISGVGQALTKAGTGTLALQGAGASSVGTLSVNAGTLLANTSLTATAVTVASSATLGGEGALTAPVAIAGTLSPGNSIGTLTVAGAGNNLTFNDGIFLVELAAAGASDRVVVGGALNLAGANDTLTLVALGGAFDGSAYTIATFGTWNGNRFDVVNGLPSGYEVLYPTDSGGLPNAIVVSAIPEPATAGLLAASAGLLTLRRRRRSM